ncbi:50S ribosomal protein L24 [Psychroflexus maritimus]|uniref:Large ribosomal subunit protein uL24 n=1 Tax=Psychroflexus maritimus TaxID=2714865 RepID=A0A967DYZ6_9FLAO|nr:50S ribosomal protein L24 [Psychroflexus maritimus]NGZ90350.1 50S ribosomal protein L24 [Psychroflexus maritimus]
MSKIKLKVGDQVRVLAGESKGKEGRILKISKDKTRAIVEGANLVKKHQKPSATNPQGGIKEMEATLHISNLSLLTKDGKTTRVGYQMQEGKKVRISKKTNEVI